MDVDYIYRKKKIMMDKLPLAVIMDLGDTIINNDSFHFNLGLKYLHDEVLTEGVAYEDLSDLATFFKENLFDLRKDNNLEVKFLDYLQYLKTVFGYRVDTSLEDIEYKFMLTAAKDSLIIDVVPILDFFKKHKVPVYILSNSTFSSLTLKRHLSEFKILNYFEEVFSSADFIFRKPHPGIFRVSYSHLKKKIGEFNKSNIMFIGNDYDKDVIGSSDFGFYPVWYNRLSKVNPKKIDLIDIKEYGELLNLLERIV
jgi:putative hydrolase of the HAD superfamily